MPPGYPIKLSPQQLRATYKLYSSGWTIPQIADQIWERFGFATPGSQD